MSVALANVLTVFFTRGGCSFCRLTHLSRRACLRDRHCAQVWLRHTPGRRHGCDAVPSGRVGSRRLQHRSHQEESATVCSSLSNTGSRASLLWRCTRSALIHPRLVCVLLRFCPDLNIHAAPNACGWDCLCAATSTALCPSAFTVAGPRIRRPFRSRTAADCGSPSVGSCVRSLFCPLLRVGALLAGGFRSEMRAS